MTDDFFWGAERVHFQGRSDILAVHINSIRGKDRLTKPLGPNPLSYVGVLVSDSGRWQH